MMIPKKLPAERSLQLDLGEFERALSGDDWMQRLVVDPLFWSFMLGLAGVVAIVVIIAARRRRDAALHRPAWRRMASSLQLSAAQRHMLDDFGRAVGLQNPVPLVISRGYFDRAVRRKHPNVAPAPVMILRRRIFDDEGMEDRL